MGPAVIVQAVELIVAPPLPVAVPTRVVVVTGSVMVRALPALTVGGVAAAAATVMVTVEVLVLPALSFTVSVNTYVPAARLPTVVVRLEAELMVEVEGPLVCVHTVELMVFPEEGDAVPVRVSVAGSVMD